MPNDASRIRLPSRAENECRKALQQKPLWDRCPTCNQIIGRWKAAQVKRYRALWLKTPKGKAYLHRCYERAKAKREAAQ